MTKQNSRSLFGLKGSERMKKYPQLEEQYGRLFKCIEGSSILVNNEKKTFFEKK